MGEEKRELVKEFRKAAKSAMDFLESSHCGLTTRTWDDDGAMQAFEDLHCADANIEDSGVNHDAVADLQHALRLMISAFGTDHKPFTPQDYAVTVATDALRKSHATK